jgi:3-dehydroquinate synthetase
VPPALAAADMLEAMGMDKKVRDGRLRFVLAEALGRVIVSEDIDLDALHATLAAGEHLCDA